MKVNTMELKINTLCKREAYFHEINKTCIKEIKENTLLVK
jgi:hypothetical protein